MLPIGSLIIQRVQRVKASASSAFKQQVVRARAVAASVGLADLLPYAIRQRASAHAPGPTLWRANRPSTSRDEALPGSGDRGVTVAPAAPVLAEGRGAPDRLFSRGLGTYYGGQH